MHWIKQIIPYMAMNGLRGSIPRSFFFLLIWQRKATHMCVCVCVCVCVANLYAYKLKSINADYKLHVLYTYGVDLCRHTYKLWQIKVCTLQCMCVLRAALYVTYFGGMYPVQATSFVLETSTVIITRRDRIFQQSARDGSYEFGFNLCTGGSERERERCGLNSWQGQKLA